MYNLKSKIKCLIIVYREGTLKVNFKQTEKKYRAPETFRLKFFGIYILQFKIRSLTNEK